MNYRNSGLLDLDYTFTVDDSKLQERLDEIESKLDETNGLTEDKVQTMIEEHVSVNDLQNADDVQSLIDQIDHDNFIADYVRSNSLMDSSDVDSAIDARMEDYVTSQDVRDIIEEMGLNSDEVADADDVEKLKDQVGDLTSKLSDLERRFELYATRVDDLKRSGADNNEAFTGYVAKLNERLTVIEERNETAMTFFGLIQKAFDLLRSKGA